MVDRVGDGGLASGGIGEVLVGEDEDVGGAGLPAAVGRGAELGFPARHEAQLLVTDGREVLGDPSPDAFLRRVKMTRKFTLNNFKLYLSWPQ